MSNNFKQALNEVFGLSKDQEEIQANNDASKLDGEETTSEAQIPEQFNDFEGFEELEPTGKSISEDAKALIDQKANLFSESLGFNLGQNVKQADNDANKSQNEENESKATDDKAEIDDTNSKEPPLTYKKIIENASAINSNSNEEINKSDFKDKEKAQASQEVLNEEKEIKKEEATPMNQENEDKKSSEQPQAKKTPFFAKEFITKKEEKKVEEPKAEEAVAEESSVTNFKDVLNETANNIAPVTTPSQLSSQVASDVANTPLQSTYTLKPVATTFIDQGTKIEGTISSNSNLNIAGDVVGDIKCGNDVFVSGNVEGNIECDNFVADNSDLKGNVITKKSLVLKNNSSITGDISGGNIEISGRVNGNILSASELSILSNSSVIGDISAKSISVEKGSIIQGKVDIKFE